MHVRPRRLATVLLAATTVLLTGVLAGCTSSGSGGGSSASSAGSGGFAASASDAGGKTSSASGGGSTVKTDDRSVVTTGDLDLLSSDPIAASHAISAVVTGAGGHVQSLSEEPKGQASADLTVRIPSAVFDATLTTIEHHAKTRSVSIHSTDVTAQVTDYGVRIANLRTSIARLQTLLARAADTADLVAIESSLTTRQTDLEELLAQQKDLADQVSYATLGVTIESPALVHATGPGTFVSGFLAGLTALGSTLATLAVIVGVLLPWVVVGGLLALVGWWAVRQVRRRRRPAGAPGA